MAVAVIVLTPEGINVIARIENEIRLRPRRPIGQRNLRGVKNQMGDARFIIHDASTIRIGDDREKPFVAILERIQDDGQSQTVR